ncbi:MAG TPA: APC family permease [Nitrospirae bacterium]|nr:APC family permease [Nitrospirota bacterium]
MTKGITEHKRGGLGELSATAICGNDITSSCLYVSALSILYAGRWAPLSLLIVVVVLYFYRSIYAEVVGALPLNGGAYNALLNTTSKFRASIAACLTILSYMATAVLSANEAMHYAHNLWSVFPVIPATILLLFIFMCITVLGITESARVAVGIFIIHLVSLALLMVIGIKYVIFNGLGTLAANMQTPNENGLVIALFFGFSAAMLGISGFESSANFVEEQSEGVFPKTLRNMWVAVSVINPGMALLALSLIPMGQIHQNQEALFAHMGGVAGGTWLSKIISIDATLVLSGAVLTSFVGVTGLVRRMTLDRCLPQFLLKMNRKGTNHRIIIAFFLLTVSILLLTRGKLTALAGVYTISFLAVMALFGLGNILLKVKRASLPRPSRAAWPVVLAGISAVIVGLLGNIIMSPAYWVVFLEYFLPAMLIISVMLGRISILKAFLYMIQTASLSVARLTGGVSKSIVARIDEINSQQIVFFTRGDNIANLNNVMLYVKNNEHTNRIKVVIVVKDDSEVPPNLEKDLEMLDQAYPAIDIEFLVVKGDFGPKLIRDLSKKWSIPTNLMFIGSPGDHFLYGLADLGGVRLII